jgi:hypothetical protein
MRHLALWCSLALVLSACSKTNITEYIEALGKDPATVCGKLTLSTPWGTQTTSVARTNIQNGNVSCPADGGLTVTTTPPMQPVGVQLVPIPPK